MRKNKSIWIKYLNIRFIKCSIYKLITKSVFLSKLLNIYTKNISIHDVGYNVVEESHSGDMLYISGMVDEEVDIIGKTGLSISRKHKMAVGPKTEPVRYNFIKPVFSPSIIEKNSLTLNLLGIHKGHKHFFHLFFDYFIPLYFYLRNLNNGRSIEILVRDDLNQIQQSLIEILEEEFKEIKFTQICSNEIVKCSSLAYFYHNHFCFYDTNKNPEIMATVNELRELILKKYKIEKGKKEKVYISRKDAKMRRILNESELTEILKKEGFSIYTLSDKSFAKQIEIFANASLVIAPHGAGFTNLLFCEEGTKFVEIFPKKFYDKGFIMLGKLRNLQRYEIIEDNEYLWQRFRINIENFIKNLNNFASFK